MKWRNCKEKEVHHTCSPMDELMAQGLATQEEEHEEQEEQQHQGVVWRGGGVEEDETTNGKAKISTTLQKSTMIS